jgi:CheY-like chemotaxis protein
MPVLVADDFPDNAELVSMTLVSAGLETVTVFSGADAIKAVEKYRPEAAVLDLSMPHIDGFMVASHFRHSPDPTVKTATLIAHTGLVSLPHRIRAMAIGFDYYLVKPDATDFIEACLGIQRGLSDVRHLTASKVNHVRHAALSERSKQALERAKELCEKYGKK